MNLLVEPRRTESSSRSPPLASGASALREAPHYRFLAIAILILLTFGLIQIRWGTVVPENGGLGFDGQVYAAIAQDLPGAISGGRLTPYSVQRIVPSTIVYCALSLLGIPKGTREVLPAFAVYNLSILILTVVLWERIGREARLGSRGLWLGFILLFINLANLRLPFHYAPLTDTTAFTLGALLVYLYLRGNRPGVLAVLVLGAFTWRSFIWLGSALFVLPHRPLEVRTPSRRFSRVILLVGAMAYAAGVSLYGLALGPPGLVAALSSSLVLAFFLIVAFGLLNNPELLRPSAYRGMASRLGILVLAGGAVLGAMLWLLPSTAANASTGDLVGQIYPFRRFFLPRVGRAVAAPALFLVNNTRYYGIAIPLLVFIWPRFCQAAHRLGVGMTVYLLAHLLLAANPESRQNIDGLTATVLALVLAGEPHLRTSRYFAVVTAGALATSTVWLPGNYVGALGLQAEMERLADVYGSVAAFHVAHPVFLRQALYVGALAVAIGIERHFVTARDDGNGAPAGSD